MRIWLEGKVKHGQASESVDLYCTDCDQQSWTVVMLTEDPIPHTVSIEQRCDCKVNPTCIDEYIIDSAFRAVRNLCPQRTT